MLLQDQLAHTRVGAQMLRPGATGQKDQVEVGVHDVGQHLVRVDGDATATGHMDCRRQRGRDHLDAGAAQQVHRRKRLDLFESFGQRNKHGGHGVGSIKYQVASIKSAEAGI